MLSVDGLVFQTVGKRLWYKIIPLSITCNHVICAAKGKHSCESMRTAGLRAGGDMAQQPWRAVQRSLKSRLGWDRARDPLCFLLSPGWSPEWESQWPEWLVLSKGNIKKLVHKTPSVVLEHQHRLGAYCKCGISDPIATLQNQNLPLTCSLGVRHSVLD